MCQKVQGESKLPAEQLGIAAEAILFLLQVSSSAWIYMEYTSMERSPQSAPANSKNSFSLATNKSLEKSHSPH
ncbi:hypothetical protein RRG08_043565 [Elysia crispata]|uniref:Uncharacterized protein n=1 Tax=Elysia crispata TaxID=231223 RepID=A0AAE1CXX5_9GAST|nr:hypothetical protein RRG08_043565 [Elysia crispata]